MRAQLAAERTPVLPTFLTEKVPLTWPDRNAPEYRLRDSEVAA